MQLMIDKADIRQTRIAPQPERSLQDGEVRVALRRCALTANNVTYAAAGEMLKYWAFFPSGSEGHGLVPVWGTADVIESRSAALAEGVRLYGFWPLAETCVLMPEEDASGMVVDRAPHRADRDRRRFSDGTHHRRHPQRPARNRAHPWRLPQL